MRQQHLRNIPVVLIAKLHIAVLKRIRIDTGFTVGAIKPPTAATRRQMVDR